MRIRHKQPTLVSMWMLDVFCCALGCVTLLFLLNSRMASDQTKASQTALIDLKNAQAKLAAAITSLDSTQLKLNAEESSNKKLVAAVSELEGLKLMLTTEVDDLKQRLATTQTDRDDLSKKLARAQTEVKDAKAVIKATEAALTAEQAKFEVNAKELAAVREKAADAEDVLRKRQKEADALAKKVTETNAALDVLNRLLRKKDEERAAMVKQTADLQKQLDDLNGKLAAANKELETTLAAAKQAAAKEMAAVRGQMKELLKRIEDANANIIDLQGDKQKLADKLDKLHKETEARFAGIVMSGRRVVFLVDISGSMGKKDYDTADPTKWPIVTETVTKVMRSIPTLEKYQVIIFSSSAKWLFGNGEWIDFAGQKSIDDVTAALLKVKPYDDTNLYAGLELAFRLRPSGLDAVYLFSDGLPTSGPGLTSAEQTRNPPLTEFELGERLGKYIRKTLNVDWNRPLPGRPRVLIHSVGFYFDSPDVGAFLWSLSRENGGSFVGMSKP